MFCILEKLDELIVQCRCRFPLQMSGMEELPADVLFGTFFCGHCGFSLGIEGDAKEMDSFVPQIIWTDEALYQLSRLPPYLAPIVRREVEEFANIQQQKVLTYSRVSTARNKGIVEWNPDAERRLHNIPTGIRAMAKVELERTALSRGMGKVTVELMEEIKSSWYGSRTFFERFDVLLNLGCNSHVASTFSSSPSTVECFGHGSACPQTKAIGDAGPGIGGFWDLPSS